MYSLAVILNGYLEGRGSLFFFFIMRTAVTFMFIFKSFSYLDVVYGFLDLRRGSSCFMDF